MGIKHIHIDPTVEPSEQGALEENGEDLRKSLKLLKDLYEEGLITEDDYATKKAAILDDL